ncbi:integrase core domain-containing protein [Methylobacterium sp. A49B]
MARHRPRQAAAERFCRKLERARDECLNEHLFRSLSAARTIIEAWRVDYNTCRPHTSLGGLTPNAFAARSRQDQNQNGLWL